MDHHKYLILVEVAATLFLVLADDEPPADGFVEFDDGTGVRMGKIVNHHFICTESAEYEMFSALHRKYVGNTIFDAAKMYGCCYKKEAADG